VRDPYSSLLGPLPSFVKLGCVESFSAGTVAVAVVAGGRGVGCIPATPPRDWHGMPVVGLPAGRCAVTEVLVSRLRGLVAVDGPGVGER
jgi:hypothetical protein